MRQFIILMGMAAPIRAQNAKCIKPIKHIADDAIEDEKLGPVYEIAITPTNTTLKVEGKTLPITAGMSVTAELKVGKRRVIEFFIYPMIKYLDEGLSVR